MVDSPKKPLNPAQLRRWMEAIAPGFSVSRNPARETDRHILVPILALVVSLIALIGILSLPPRHARAIATQKAFVVSTESKINIAAPDMRLIKTKPFVRPVVLEKSANLPKPVNDNPAAPMSRARHGPAIALIIDDIGPSVPLSRQALALPFPVTYAILPYARMAANFAAMAKKRNDDILVHLPMEPRGLQNPGPGALLRALPARENRRRMRAALDKIPGAIGVNNHMGSRFTTCARCLAPLMGDLHARGLGFVDSLTTGHSHAAQEARRADVVTLSRDVFLDDSDRPEAIKRQMHLAAQLARQKGVAIVIAHPRKNTLAALHDWQDELAAQGIEMIKISTLFAQEGHAHQIRNTKIAALD